jgi:hypothetical protein
LRESSSPGKYSLKLKRRFNDERVRVMGCPVPPYHQSGGFKDIRISAVCLKDTLRAIPAPDYTDRPSEGSPETSPQDKALI